jgi:uncharacterized protein YecE (DUF72 family)
LIFFHTLIQPVSLPQMASVNQLFYSGTSGLNLPVSRSKYPAEFQGKSRLQFYASLFNSIEINSIFYKLPRNATVANWAESVPDNFRFTFKVSKTITHAKGLQFAVKDVRDFIDTVNNIGEKKGCLLAQFPPSLKIEKMDQLQSLLETLGEATHNSGWKVAIEFRHSSWYEREVQELLEEYDAAMVIQDMPKSATPLDYVKGDFVYLRFHGPEPRYRGDYSDDFLKQYAGYINNWINEKKTVYAYFNNTVGAAVENLVTLNKFVAKY